MLEDKLPARGEEDSSFTKAEVELYDDSLSFAADLIHNNSGLIRFLGPNNRTIIELPVGKRGPKGWIKLGPAPVPLNARVRIAAKVLSWQGEVGSKENAAALRGELKNLFALVKGEGDPDEDADGDE